MKATLPGMSASQLFAKSQGATLHGDQKCHWCGSPCQRSLLHDDLPPMIGVRRQQPCKDVNSPYICVGCWLYRRRRVTLFKVGGGFKDGQSAGEQSWWMTEEGAWTINDDNKQSLYPLLINPPRQFVLAFRVREDHPNFLQSMVCNDLVEVMSTTELRFTVDGTVFPLSVLELEEAIEQHDRNYPSPGVMELFRLLGMPPRKEGPGAKTGGGAQLREDRAVNKVKKIVRAMASSGG